MFDQFLALIEHYAKLSDEETEWVRSIVPVHSYKKNEVVFCEGNVARTIYFVLQGCVRLFYSVEGNEKTAFFYAEGKFICAGESYTLNTPARENYQAIEDTVLMCFDKHSIETLLRLSPTFELIARIATEDELITCQRMIASFVTKSPEERYRELLATNASLFQRVPQQYIASFLGVSPETLSRIKRRVVEKARVLHS